MYELLIIVPLFYVFYVLSRMSAGPPTGQTQLGSVPGGFSLSIGDTTAQHQHAPNTFSHQDRLELPDDPDDPDDPDVPGVTPTPEPDVPGGAPIPEPDRSAPRDPCTCYLRSSGVCDLCSAGYKLFHYMISSRPPPVKSPAPTFRSTEFGSCRVPVPLFDDSATAQTASLDGSSGAEAAPYDNDSAPPVAPAPSTSSQPAAPPANTTTPAPFQVAAASTDTTPAASHQVAAPSAPSNNGASLGLNPAGQGSTEEHTPAPPVNFTAYRLLSKTRAPSTGVKRARQTPSFIARRLQKAVVVKQCNPADRSKIRRIAVPIRTRQSLKGRYRSLATRHDLGRLGLGFRANGVSVRQRFTNSAGVVRLGSGMTLRDNRLRRRRRTSSVNEIRARQRQRARKEMRASQRLRKYPATTPDINVIPATPPAIPNSGGATGWLPVGWSNFGQGARTDVTTPAASTDVTMSAHVQLATTPTPPTLTGPTQTITPIGPTQATFMTATPTPPTEFAPTGFAQTIIPPAAPTGFGPTTTATASPASNTPTQAGLTLPPPTSTGPAPPATTFTFTSTSGPSCTQPQTNVSAHIGGGSRGRQSGRLGNRTGKGGTNQKAKPTEPPVNSYVSRGSYERRKFTSDCRTVVHKYDWITKRRRHLRTVEATRDTLTVDRMYYALLYITAKELQGDEDPTELERQLRELYNADDTTIRARYERMVEIHPSRALEDVDVYTYATTSD
ncbi:hypothetical protein GGH92_004528 [Coemansia sp. RSA 2673]|nr:hypothetical protein H4S03_003888 [Coemansia sp. S3946]KAJ2344344.1 hypothetical protein GGH92_004528 [Coemansia sp. RSA 2673]